MKVRDVIKMIESDGWYQVAQKGSHRQYKHPSKSGRVTGGRSSFRGDGQGHAEQHLQTGGIEMMRYAVVFEKTPTGWSASAPDLPGLGVAAATIEEAEQLIHEGIEFHIEGLREDGLPIPSPDTQVKQIAIPA